MANEFESSSDIIVSTEAFEEATRFYGSVLGLPVTHSSETLVASETGSFCLYVERGQRHGPVFEFLLADVKAAKDHLIAAGCTIVEEDASVPRCYIQDPYGIVFNVGRASG